MTKYLLNAFSLQMLAHNPAIVSVEEITTLPPNLESAIGHQETANVLNVPFNRINVVLKPGDIAYVAQLQGGRLPEGAKTLPPGFKFKFYRLEVG